MRGAIVAHPCRPDPALRADVRVVIAAPRRQHGRVAAVIAAQLVAVLALSAPPAIDTAPRVPELAAWADRYRPATREYPDLELATADEMGPDAVRACRLAGPSGRRHAC